MDGIEIMRVAFERVVEDGHTVARWTVVAETNGESIELSGRATRAGLAGPDGLDFPLLQDDTETWVRLGGQRPTQAQSALHSAYRRALVML